MSLQPKVKDRSWHYGFWRGSYRILWLTPPERFSICPYFWRVVLFAPFLLYPLGIVLRICSPPVRLVGFLWTSFWKLFPEKIDDRPQPQPFKERHPKLAKAGKVVGTTVLVVIAVALAALVVFCFISKPKALVIMLLTIGFYVAIIGIVIGMVAALRSDTAGLIGDFLKAKKERVCPFVEVIRT